MKTYVSLLLFLIGFLLLAITSCEDKTEAAPDFPQLIGYWTGNTSQGQICTFNISNHDGTLYVDHYKVEVITNTGLKNYESTNSKGIAPVINKQFMITLGAGINGDAFINGVFNVNDITLYGNFEVYPSGNNIDKIFGTYLASLNMPDAAGKELKIISSKINE
jgi:hypothetical protein